MESDHIEIVRAVESDVARIAEIAASRSLDGAHPSTAPRDGFLVSGYTVDTYRARLATAEHFYVARKGSNVVGFLLAYSDQRIESDEWLNHHIKTTLGNFLVIKQVCVERESARLGIGSRLYHHVLEQWTTSPVIAAVVSDPPNEASTLFHRKLGFEELTRLTPPDGRQRTVWVRRKAREAMLQVQYSVAVDLYKHEDTTNWHKLNNFFYITAGLAAAMAFSLSKDSGESEPLSRGLAIVLSVIGLGASMAFSQMLRFGRRYLLARKQAVIELEEYMAWHGGQRIVAREAGESGNGWLKSSPTGLIMVLLPILVALCWLAMLSVLIAV
ncbi:GNAT family N-acetyltransferase [Streptomyces luteolifulvus]|uniref:GNAT family N-acetyltransferase n=1 Tax=Streptomyces luteolifulvus TaxID=2615112 RepID=A0A6H9UWJ3_9ACTN|nr:GNAT family N-acetyltransferase [Streptomyces luteolifulvus]KAB1143504.1 GNAT family N-acetyltransferase [Streptomyces luteolifulvus]